MKLHALQSQIMIPFNFFSLFITNQRFRKRQDDLAYSQSMSILGNVKNFHTHPNLYSKYNNL